MKKKPYNEIEIIKHVEGVGQILSSVRLLEHQLFDICKMNDAIEDDLIHLKLRLKSLKMNIYAVEDITN